MFIDEIKNRFSKMHTTFLTNNGFTEAVIDSCVRDDKNNSLCVYASLKNVSNVGVNSESKVLLGNIPCATTGGLINYNGVYYNIVKGLVVKDGFYLKEGCLKFIRNDKVLFTLVLGNGGDVYLTTHKNVKIPLYTYLFALGMVDMPEDMVNLFGNSYSFGATVNNQCKNDAARTVYQALFGYLNGWDYTNSLYVKTFDGFYNTGSAYENKPIFFSYSRYIGMQLVSCNDDSIATGLIDIELARKLDLKKVKKVTLRSKNRNKFDVSTDYRQNFTQLDLVNAIKLLIHSNRYKSEISHCDIYSLYNRSLFTYTDYVCNYLLIKAESFVKKQSNKNLFNTRNLVKGDQNTIKDFITYVRENFGKGLEPVAINNVVTFDSTRDMFIKDLFRNDANTISQEERMFHTTYFGWINPSLTSDSSKVGLSGQFVMDACDNKSIRRKFSYCKDLSDREPLTETSINSIDEEDDYILNIEKNTVYLQPYQTFNNKILYLEPDKTFSVFLNGVRLENQYASDCDLLCETSTIKEQLSCITPATNANQGKRHGLGNKAINQALPSIGVGQNKRRGLISDVSNKVVGVRASDILQTILEGVGTEDTLDGIKYLTVKDISISNKTYNFDIKLNTGVKTYSHPMFMTSVTENTRLKFKIIPSSTGTNIYKLDDYVIVCGEYEDVGEECNIMFANLGGNTYEDGITVTSNFVKRMGLSTKLYFVQKVIIEGALSDVGVQVDGAEYLDSRGLPKEGSFIGYNSVLCSVLVDGKLKTVLSNNYGYVESVQITPLSIIETKNIRITLSDVRCLRAGDKVGNGHGNKGVIVNVLDSSYLKTESGDKPDLILNPLGIWGRMNFGQVKEMLGNTLSEYSAKRLTFEESGVNTLSLKELTNKCIENNSYKKLDIYYKGYRLGSKAFLGKMVMYRMKHFSEIQLKSTCMPRLSVNHRIETGQKMSELCTNVYEAYGCSEELKYMMVYQSRNPKATLALKESLVEDIPLDTNRYEDTSKYRISAMMNCLGLKMTDAGITHLRESDLDDLNVLLQGEDDIRGSLVDETIHGNFNVGNIRGYKLTSCIDVGHPIIMPYILDKLSTYVSIRNPYREDSSKVLRSCLQDICVKEVYGLRLSANKDCIEYITSDDKISNPNEYSYGYFNLVRILGQLDPVRVLSLIKKPNIAVDFENRIRESGSNGVFKDFILSAVPVAPINLRPQFKGRSGQSIDSYYGTLLGKIGDDAVIAYNTLRIISRDFKSVLFQHGKVKALSNERSHAEKNAEVRDVTVARRYCFSTRGVAGFDLSLKPYELAIPLKSLLFTLNTIIVDKVVFDYTSGGLDNPELFELCKTNEELKRELNKCMSNIYSGVTTNKQIEVVVIRTLKKLLKGKACSMVREPILRRQGNYYYVPVIGSGDSIKVNPIVCASYNLDFDGDAVPVFMCMNNDISTRLLKKMNPYFGMYDLDSKAVWLKPNQDSLFGLYLVTKDSATEDVVKMISYSTHILKDLLFETRHSNLKYSDTITIVKDKYARMTNTVGKFILLYTILNDPIGVEYGLLSDLLDVLDKPLTSKNISDFIRYLDDSSLSDSDGYAFSGDNEETLGQEHSISMLMMIHRVNKLGFDIVTDRGVTLLPSELASVRDSYEVRGELLKKEPLKTVGETDVFSNSEFSNLLAYTPVFKVMSKGLLGPNMIRAEIFKDIENVTFLKDLLASGARGTVSDCLQLWDSIGEIKYDGVVTKVDRNYTRGSNYIDLMTTSQVVRLAKVNTQCNLGRKSATIKERQLLASSIKLDGHHCEAEPLNFTIRYDVIYNGLNLNTYNMLEVQDELLRLALNDILMCRGETKFPGVLISKMVQKLAIRNLNGVALEYRLSKEFKAIAENKYVIYKNNLVLGSTVFDDLLIDRPTHIKIHTLYTCVRDSGICETCYGLVDNKLGLKAVGMNTIFSVGQHSVQATLDASKQNTGKNSPVEDINILRVYATSVVESQMLIVDRDSLGIQYSADGTVSIQKVDIEDGAKIKLEFNLDLEYFDVYWDTKDFFVPNCYTNFLIANFTENNETLERIYENMLYQFVNSISMRSLDLILSMNTRFVICGSTVIPFSKATMRGRRTWLVHTRFTKEQDILLNLILNDPMGNLIDNIFNNKKYRTSGTILSDLLTLDKIEEGFLRTSNIINPSYIKGKEGAKIITDGNRFTVEALVVEKDLTEPGTVHEDYINAPYQDNLIFVEETNMF